MAKDKAADMRDRDKAHSSPSPDKKLTNRGQAKAVKATVPGADWKAGTPGYIRSAADAAEKHARDAVRNFGSGIQEAARHRVSGGWNAGKPDVKKDADYCNTMKETD